MLTFMRGRAARERILRRMNHRWNLRSRTRADHLDPEEGGIQEVCWPELPKTQNCRRYCYCHSKNWTSGRRRPTRIFDWQRIGTWHSCIGSLFWITDTEKVIVRWPPSGVAGSCWLLCSYGDITSGRKCGTSLLFRCRCQVPCCHQSVKQLGGKCNNSVLTQLSHYLTYA